MKHLLILFILLSFLFLSSYCQDTIKCIFGAVIPCKRVLTIIPDNILAIDSFPFGTDTLRLLSYEIQKKHKTKVKKIPTTDVFCIKYSDGTEKVIYKRDTINGLIYTQEEARLIMLGGQDAINNYYLSFSNFLSVSLGFAGAFLNWYGMWITPIFVGIVEFFPPNVTVKKGACQQYMDNKYYQLGFQNVAKQKRIENNFLLGYLGWALGVGFIVILI